MMMDERASFNETPYGKTYPKNIPTLLAIWKAATAIELPSERVEWVVERYAERNTLAHYAITQLMQTGHWGQLATVLHYDAKDLAVVITPGMEEDIIHMLAVIRYFRTMYFIIEKGDEDHPDAWRANEKASQYRKELRANIENKEKEEG